MTDVFLYQTANDGEIDIDQGDVLMTGGLETAVYLSLFGGNFRDDGTTSNPKQWWGNADVNEPQEKQTSRFQYFVNSSPATSANLRKAEDLAEADLAWLKREYDIQINATIPSFNKIKITVSITSETFEFLEDWATL